MTTATYERPNNATQSATRYKANLDAAFKVFERLASAFAPHEQDNGSPAPEMSVRIDAGYIFSGTTLTEVAAQTVGGFTTPSAGQERYDRVVINSTTGAASRVAGTASTGSPSAGLPAIPSGYLPCCYVKLTSADTVITNSMITDERVAANANNSSGSPRSYLAGMTLSTAGSSSTMSIAAGVARDSTNAADITLASAISKTTSAFSAGTGNGGLDTGAIANNTWYHFYAIDTPGGSAGDVTFSLSASTPTLNGSYVGGKYRRIGAGKTNGSGQWIKFVQDGDDFTWDTPVMDSSVTGSATATTLTLASVPTGVRVKAIVNSTYSGGGLLTYMSDLSNADLAPSLTAAPGTFSGQSSATQASGNNVGIYTNTSAQIRHRESAATGPIIFVTIGWTDTRGRNA